MVFLGVDSRGLLLLTLCSRDDPGDSLGRRYSNTVLSLLESNPLRGLFPAVTCSQLDAGPKSGRSVHGSVIGGGKECGERTLFCSVV